MAANTKPFFETVLGRRTYYALTPESPISDERVKEIVEFAVKNCPSSYNVQSARAVILVKEQHQKLWDMADGVIKRSLPEAVYNALGPRIQGFRNAYGSVCWFESQEDIDNLVKQHPAIAAVATEWSDHSTGMHQFVVWAALEAEGLGCNLQHFNFMDAFTQEVRAEWKIPETWKLKAQLVFGTPVAPPMDKTFKPLEERVFLH